MTLLYLDTSALLRLYTQEPEYGAVMNERQQSGGVICHDITYVEAVAAFAGRRARKLLTGQNYQAALGAFEADWPTFRHVSIDEQLLRDAAQLATTYTLRAYDAVHLAAAQAVAPLGLQFMTFDLKLRAVAEQVLSGQVWQP
ncbi:type II toxin-antitoxin system VapC family toxin [Deinococcus arenicola]|uniref:Type II toxin-antitoxin system VapC family toxin n=1 Tax=Deinococcus arenicola TaxID=2994950 RepID=A0ABU4DRM2_9DEIO|nr:type II toxin-antitoxin system VapC family toxin [Deinococcus sp. ZS9-10]MDV6375072.1 type II toxin-antitoxin system VapC family toxin [Deinococcus sp. ZS9-10]